MYHAWRGLTRLPRVGVSCSPCQRRNSSFGSSTPNSATVGDLPEASFAGQQSTFLNVVGEDRVAAAVKECWASLFEARAIFYGAENTFDNMEVVMGVPVQKMVQCSASYLLRHSKSTGIRICA